MTITRELQNLSANTAESVNIKPFTRNGWVIVDTSRRNGNLSNTESRMAGETPELPLVRRVTIRPVQVYHPAAEDVKYPGKRYAVDVHTSVKVTNSVNGEEVHYPISVSVAINSGGTMLLDTTDVLSFVLSTVAELYDSVTSGVPESVTISKFGLGVTNI